MNNRVSIYITNLCNARCSYCYQKETGYFDIKEDKVINEVEESFKNNKDNIYFELIGGEPFIKFEMIKKVTNLIKKRSKELNIKTYISISTNGTIINEEIIDFLLANNIELSISLDGTKFMNQFRLLLKEEKNMYSDVVENIKILLKYFKNLRVHMSIHEYNVGWFFEGVKSIYNLGVKNIDVGLIEGYGFDLKPDSYEYLEKKMEKVSKWIRDEKIEDLFFEPFNFIETKEQKKYIKDENNIVLKEKYVLNNEKKRTKKDILFMNVSETNNFIRCL